MMILVGMIIIFRLLGIVILLFGCGFLMSDCLWILCGEFVDRIYYAKLFRLYYFEWEWFSYE